MNSRPFDFQLSLSNQTHLLHAIHTGTILRTPRSKPYPASHHMHLPTGFRTITASKRNDTVAAGLKMGHLGDETSAIKIRLKPSR